MAIVLTQVEAIPAAYPAPPADLSPAAIALSADAIWARIENHIGHRFTARAVVWTVEGEGDWTLPLTPATMAGLICQ